MNTGQMTLKVYPAMRTRIAQWLWMGMAALGLVLIIGSVFVSNLTGTQELLPTKVNVETMTLPAFAERCGLQVQSIKLSSTDGLIEFRMKIVDAQKAEQFLADPAEMPRLIVPDQGLTLFAKPVLDQSINFVDGEVIYLLYGNLAEAVKPGMFVIVTFGEFQLERMPVDETDFNTISASPASPNTPHERIGVY
jgi:hypothetical protein